MSRIKQPDFEAGETWNSGDKENAIREFNAINNLLSQSVVTEATYKRREADRLKRLKDYVAKTISLGRRFINNGYKMIKKEKCVIQ